jgi:hypothetical protein
VKEKGIEGTHGWLQALAIIAQKNAARTAVIKKASTFW